MISVSNRNVKSERIMKKALMAMMIAGFCAAPSLASAANPYMSANLGVGFAGNSNFKASGATTNDARSYKTGFPIGGSVGLKSDKLRLEAALGYQANTVDQIRSPATGAFYAAPGGNRVALFSFMANAFYDYAPEDSAVLPYVTGGLGGVTINPQGDSIQSGSKSVFAWQVGAGVGIRTSENTVVDLGFRYLKTSSYDVDDPVYGAGKFTASSSNVMLGLRYDF